MVMGPGRMTEDRNKGREEGNAEDRIVSPPKLKAEDQGQGSREGRGGEWKGEQEKPFMGSCTASGSLSSPRSAPQPQMSLPAPGSIPEPVAAPPYTMPFLK